MQGELAQYTVLLFDSDAITLELELKWNYSVLLMILPGPKAGKK